jgi:hypothetical protein
MTLSKRDFDVLRDRVSKLESKLGALEFRTQNIEKRIAPQEIYRVVKSEEKAREIEKAIEQGQHQGQEHGQSDQPA